MGLVREEQREVLEEILQIVHQNLHQDSGEKEETVQQSEQRRG